MMYRDVVKTLSTMDGDRRCLHSVNNVMEDKTVKEVLVDLENERKEVRWMDEWIIV